MSRLASEVRFTRNQSENFGGLSIIMLGFLGSFVEVSSGFPLLLWGCTPQHNYKKIIGQSTTLNSCEKFLKFYSISIG